MFYKVHSEILKFNFPSMIEVTMQSEKYAPPKIQNIFHYQQTENICHIYSVQSDMIQWGVYENHSNITEKGRFEQHALNY
jgi:hypothetical protein